MICLGLMFMIDVACFLGGLRFKFGVIACLWLSIVGDGVVFLGELVAYFYLV